MTPLHGTVALLALAFVIAASVPWAACSDCGAPLQPELTVFWGVIPCIFFIEGLSFPTTAMLVAGRRVGVHLSIQLYSFGVIPVLVLGALEGLAALGFPQPPLRREAFLALAAVPTTTSMCVMHSSLAGANAPLAAFSAVLGNVLAIGLTPALLSALCGAATRDLPGLAVGVAGKMVLPLAAGQILRPRLAPHGLPPTASLVNRLLILCLLVQILSDIVFWGGVAASPAALARIVPAACALHAALLLLAWAAGGLLLRLAAADLVPFALCASHKTVVLGLPLLRAAFADRSPETRAMLLLPLISYHLFELLLGVAAAPRLRRWVDEEQAKVQV